MSHKTDKPKQDLKLKKKLVIEANKNHELIRILNRIMEAVKKQIGEVEYKKLLNSIGLEAK